MNNRTVAALLLRKERIEKMNKETEDLLRDLFVGATIDSEEVQGINFTLFNNGDVLFNICSKNISSSINWHYILVPSENMQFVQDRLTSVSSTISSAMIAPGDK